jgi:hypothetical protein
VVLSVATKPHPAADAFARTGIMAGICVLACRHGRQV